MKKHYKEFFYSEDPKTLETERKKRGALHAIFPHLMGGSEDHTSYILLSDNKKVEQFDNTTKKEEPFSSGNNRETFNFEPWKREQTLSLMSEITYPKLNGTIGITTLNRPAYRENEFEYMNKAKFNSVIEESFRFEGGYSNNKYDRGGKTNYGITEIFMEQYRDALPNGRLIPIEELTKENAHSLYFAMWNKYNLGYIRDKDLAFVINDYMINTYDHKVAKRIQRILNQNGENLATDGIFGAKTIEAIHRTNKEWLIEQILIDRYNNFRENVARDYSQINNYKGWINRLNKIAEIVGSKLRFSNEY
ncbi:MAG: hypothetical protein E7088_04860 [Bacteroidales bacterium]|nr:hypothetical protein [Bacteroidales bacterium]